MVTRRGRWEKLCARGAWPGLLGGPSTSPLGVTVTSPSGIALVAASALFVAGFSTSVLSRIGGHAFTPTSIAFTGGELVVVSGLVWVGTYIGARRCVPRRRTARLARVLALLYGALGVALAIPIKTHAAVVNVPASGSPSINPIAPMVISVAALLAVILTPPFLVRGIAAACADKDQS